LAENFRKSAKFSEIWIAKGGENGKKMQKNQPDIQIKTLKISMI